MNWSVLFCLPLLVAVVAAVSQMPDAAAERFMIVPKTVTVNTTIVSTSTITPSAYCISYYSGYSANICGDRRRRAILAENGIQPSAVQP